MLDFSFFVMSVALGVGDAMDAFSVSLANGLNEPNMKPLRTVGIASVFGIFQFIMPMIGWILVHTIVRYFTVFEKFIPFIALGLLGFIGGKMLIDGIKNGDSEVEKPATSVGELIIQGIATSIDALSVGFTIASYDLLSATVCALIIGVVTFIICVLGVILGKKFGTRLAGKATVLGGIILIAIGIIIFIKGII